MFKGRVPVVLLSAAFDSRGNRKKTPARVTAASRYLTL
jgi:hypothetical protein